MGGLQSVCSGGTASGLLQGQHHLALTWLVFLSPRSQTPSGLAIVTLNPSGPCPSWLLLFLLFAVDLEDHSVPYIRLQMFFILFKCCFSTKHSRAF